MSYSGCDRDDMYSRIALPRDSHSLTDARSLLGQFSLINMLGPDSGRDPARTSGSTVLLAQLSKYPAINSAPGPVVHSYSVFIHVATSPRRLIQFATGYLLVRLICCHQKQQPVLHNDTSLTILPIWMDARWQPSQRRWITLSDKSIKCMLASMPCCQQAAGFCPAGPTI